MKKKEQKKTKQRNSVGIVWVARMIEMGTLALSFLWAAEAYSKKPAHPIPIRKLASLHSEDLSDHSLNPMTSNPISSNNQLSLLQKDTRSPQLVSGFCTAAIAPSTGPCSAAISPSLWNNPYFARPSGELFRFPSFK